MKMITTSWFFALLLSTAFGFITPRHMNPQHITRPGVLRAQPFSDEIYDDILMITKVVSQRASDKPEPVTETQFDALEDAVQRIIDDAWEFHGGK
eukprot:CAMPEP_0185775046 /NCGR_PEP_ID=MMETSP1174-20130828/81053_1 /TAXON_ID=35687 /ORGANISM="Dictyocha speculum, Strain CCMP1381" /LENGTH=94 /DNA_ID=CAMNT_0028462503 /DNA_START=1 /DNA_END=285 /DNA_ORIENTATION=+